MSDPQPRLSRQQQSLIDILTKCGDWMQTNDIAKSAELSPYNAKQALNILVDREFLTARRKPGAPTCYRIKTKVQST